MYRPKALHCECTPPNWPAFAAHRLGSVSLCGGVISNCAHPQYQSLGKNMRSELAAGLALAVGCESATAFTSVAGFESCASRVTCNIRQTRNSNKSFIDR